MVERLFDYSISDGTIKKTLRLLEPVNYFISDVVEYDMKKFHPDLYEYIDAESLTCESKYYYKLGSGIGYCLFGNPQVHKYSYDVTDEDIRLHKINKLDSYSDFGTDLACFVSPGILARSIEITGWVDGKVNLCDESTKKDCLLSGLADSSLPFISKIEAEYFVREQNILR